MANQGSVAVWTVWGRPEFSPMMTILTESLQDVGINTPTPPRSNFHLGSRSTLQNWLKDSGFNDITMWYQPMVVSFDDPLRNSLLILYRTVVTYKIYQKTFVNASLK